MTQDSKNDAQQHPFVAFYGAGFDNHPPNSSLPQLRQAACEAIRSLVQHEMELSGKVPWIRFAVQTDAGVVTVFMGDAPPWLGVPVGDD